MVYIVNNAQGIHQPLMYFLFYIEVIWKSPSPVPFQEDVYFLERACLEIAEIITDLGLLPIS